MNPKAILLWSLALGAAVTMALPLAANAENLSSGETLAEYDSLKFPYLDRRAIVVSEGAGELDFSNKVFLQDQDRIALKFVNDAAHAVNVDIPAFKINFVVPANSERVYEFVSSELGNVYGDNGKVAYTVTSLESQNRGGIGKSQALMDIINAKIVVPTFVDDEPPPPVRRGAGADNGNVRGYW
ncbi:MAG: hypothetical protein IPK79_06615 [Vampirovibrionales bacterium]|nr:hypothetical protein [Vampirovibrionales bacterium]